MRTFPRLSLLLQLCIPIRHYRDSVPLLNNSDLRISAVRGVQRFNPAPFEAAIKRLVKVHLGDGATGDEMMRSRGNQGCKV